MNLDAQAKAMRIRMYMLCSECVRLIDLVESRPQQRQVEAPDISRHSVEQHLAWLEVLGLS